jgi:hypothetical protein
LDEPEWYLFNDSMVKPAQISEILTKYNGRKEKRVDINREYGKWEEVETQSDETAYLLVYIKDSQFNEYHQAKCRIPQAIVNKHKKKHR